MAQATVCDQCNTRIGSRSPDHTSYGWKDEHHSGPDVNVTAFGSQNGILIQVNKKGDYCAPCVIQNTLLGLGVARETVDVIMAAKHVAAGETFKRIEPTVEERVAALPQENLSARR
jgi:hypothetical protein